MTTAAQTYGIVLPIAHGPRGYFNQSRSVFEQVKTNINMLLRTKRGERRMNPNFGSGLWNILFEFNDANLPMMVENTVKKDIERWLPYLTITKVTVKNGTDEKNKYAVGVSVSFISNSAGISTPQTVEVLMQQGNL
jgi:phage baseplate assembly protein W